VPQKNSAAWSRSKTSATFSKTIVSKPMIHSLFGWYVSIIPRP
jgi:hypothetical protein